MGIGQRKIRIVVSDETLSLEKKQHQIGGHLLLPKSLNQGFPAQQRSRRSSRGPSSLWNCAHTAETIFRQTACFDFFFREQHLKYFQEEVDVEPPDSETLSDDGEKEGDADDEEDGGQQDVHRRENEQLQKHFHF